MRIAGVTPSITAADSSVPLAGAAVLLKSRRSLLAHAL